MRYGIHEAGEIVKQGGLFMEAFANEENAEAKAKLIEEDFDEEEEAKGNKLVEDGRTILAEATGGPVILGNATDAQNEAEEELLDLFSRTLKKTRGKLVEDDANQPLLEGMNDAIRRKGQSAGALSARVEAFLSIIGAPFARKSEEEAKVTIRQVARLKATQEEKIKEKLASYLASQSHQDGATGQKLELTEEKEESIRKLDRWLAKWQHICKAEFTEAELKAFGIPVNVAKSRRRKKKKEEPTAP